MKTKEDIYNNISQINVNDAGTTTESRTSGYVKLTNRCIICGNECGNLETMICDDCKEAIRWLKVLKKKLYFNNDAELKNVCPHCGSSDIQFLWKTSAGYHTIRSHYICHKCSKEFECK